MCGSRLFIFAGKVLIKFTKTLLLYRVISNICGFVRRIRNSIDAIQKQKRSHVRKVLVYDTDEGETARCFIDALKRQLGVFELQDFGEANDEEKATLSIIAVVRHTSIRMPEILSEVTEHFDKENVKDLKRVFVTYIYGSKQDEDYIDKIQTGKFNFATIVPIDFINKCLVWKLAADLRIYWKIFLKRTNVASLRKLERCIISRKVTTKYIVNIYVDVDSPRMQEFIAELRQKISSSIHLQDVKPLEELTNETTPTLICTTGDVKECVEECQRKLKEEGLKKVFLVHIIDVGKRSEIRVMHGISDDMENKPVIHDEQNRSSTLLVGAENNTAQNDKTTPCEIHEILDYNGKIIIECALVKKFETFVADGLIK